MRACVLGVVAMVLAGAPVAWAQQGAAGVSPAGEVLATVGDSVITVRDYAMTLRSEVRRRFYHAKPRESELAAFHREVADRMIDRQLALQEARRLGLKPDTRAVESEIKTLRDRSNHQEKGPGDKAFWAAMRTRVEEENVLGRFRARLRDGVDQSETAVRRYYEAHPEKFTEPERVKVSVILLKVQASSAQPVWDAAHAEATRIADRLRQRADFSELARLHSADSSAARGGDLGYLHKGMLGTTVEGVLDAMQPGQVSAPVTVLEGVALFKLDDRTSPHLMPIDKVKERVRELLLKEEESRVWDATIARLREKTPIRLEEKYLMPG